MVKPSFVILEDLVEHPELGLIEGGFLLEGVVLISGVILDSHQRQIAQPVAVLVDGLVDMLGELIRNGLWPDVLGRETVVLVVDGLLYSPINRDYWRSRTQCAIIYHGMIYLFTLFMRTVCRISRP